MSSLYARQVARLRDEIAKLHRDKASQASTIADLTRRINSASEAAARASSSSTLKSKLNEIERHQKSLAAAERKAADIEGKIARKHADLTRAQQNQTKEETRERKKHQREVMRQSDELSRVSRRVTDHDRLHRDTMIELERLRSLPEKIVVLFFAANPLDQDSLRLDEEVRTIAEMIRKSKHRDAVKLESCWAVRPGDVLQGINEFGPHIVHFSGHGSDEDEIVFQDDRGGTKLVSKDALVQLMMATSGSTRLAFFNTCFSRNQAEAVVRHVDAAIGMNTSIGDEAARVFASQFYSAIGFGLSVQQAFDQAKALLMMEGISEENTPELFVRDGLAASDLIIVRPPSAGSG